MRRSPALYYPFRRPVVRVVRPSGSVQSSRLQKVNCTNNEIPLYPPLNPQVRMLCGGKTHTAPVARVRYVRDARLEAGWAQRMRHARARIEIIISEEVVLVVWLRPLGADAVVEGVVAIPVGSVVVGLSSRLFPSSAGRALPASLVRSQLAWEALARAALAAALAAPAPPWTHRLHRESESSWSHRRFQWRCVHRLMVAR